ELATTGVVVPHIVDRPHVIFADYRANALDRRNSRSHAGFAIESVTAAATAGIALLTARLTLRRVDLPVAGRDIFIRSAHLHATVAGDAGFLSRCRGNDRVGPEQVFLDVEIHLLDIRRRRIVAAIQPHHQAGM